MTVYNIHEAKTHLSQLLERAMKNEEVIIAKAGKPIARIVSLNSAVCLHARVAGIDKGKIVIQPDFNDPLSELGV